MSGVCKYVKKRNKNVTLYPYELQNDVSDIKTIRSSVNSIDVHDRVALMKRYAATDGSKQHWTCGVLVKLVKRTDGKDMLTREKVVLPSQLDTLWRYGNSRILR